MAENGSTRGHGDLEHWTCRCGNLISGKDPHQGCPSCLGLEHARQAVDNTGLCPHCAVFTTKSLRRRLGRQVSLSGKNPWLPSATPGIKGKQGWGDATTAAPLATASWGSQLDLIMGSQEGDVLELDYGDDVDAVSNLLISEDEKEDNIFATMTRAAQPLAPAASSVGDEGGTPAAPPPSSDMLDVCKRAATRLDLPWPVAVVEAPRSRYEEKKLPLARSAVKQSLPVFPELEIGGAGVLVR